MRFWNGLRNYGDSLAFITSSHTISYAELDKKVDDCTALLKQKFERPFVMLNTKNTIGSIMGYLACLRSKIPVMLVDAQLHQDLRTRLIETYRPNLILDSEAISVAIKATSFPEPTPCHDALRVLLSTSGSTGSPKFVRLTQENLVANSATIASYLKLSATERPISSLPMHYSYGLSVINSHLSVGATILLTQDTIMQKPFWDFAKDQEMTSFSGVPYMYEMLDRLQFFEDLPKSLTTLTQAGGKLSLKLAKKIVRISHKNDILFYIMYGQTEATARISYVPVEDVSEKFGSIGISIPGGKLRLENDELVYEGPNVMMGYALTAEDATKGDDCKGVLHTGDLARQDDDGFFYIIGRKKRFVKLFGNRVNLDDIEEKLKSEGIYSVVTGVDDMLKIFVDEASIIESVSDILKTVFKFHPSTFLITTIEVIPRTSTGKVNYEQLQ